MLLAVVSLGIAWEYMLFPTLDSLSPGCYFATRSIVDFAETTLLPGCALRARVYYPGRSNCQCTSLDRRTFPFSSANRYNSYIHPTVPVCQISSGRLTGRSSYMIGRSSEVAMKKGGVWPLNVLGFLWDFGCMLPNVCYTCKPLFLFKSFVSVELQLWIRFGVGARRKHERSTCKHCCFI